MELEVGGIYKIERKPMNMVKLFERKSDAGRHYYKHSMNVKILVIHKTKNIKRNRGQKYIAYFFGQNDVEHFIECLYSVWIKKVYLIKKERDISQWPHLARKHFLIAKGVSTSTAMEGTIEDARRQITNIARIDRLQKEKREKKRDTISDFKTMTGKSFYVNAETGTATAEVSIAPRYEREYTTADWHDSTEEMMAEPSDYDECDDEICEEEIESVAPPLPSEPLPEPAPVGLHPGYMKKPKKKAKKKRNKKKNQLPTSQNLHTVGGYGKINADSQATMPPYRSRSEDKIELESLAYGKGIDPKVRNAAVDALKAMEEEDVELRETIQKANEKLKRPQFSFSAWYEEQQKTEETE
jgi:hypothetical protein